MIYYRVSATKAFLLKHRTLVSFCAVKPLVQTSRNPSKYSENLCAGAFIQPMLPLSSLMEPNSPLNMESKGTNPGPSRPIQSGSSVTPREEIRNAWACIDSDNHPVTPRAGNTVDTPSSLGDVEASVPVPVPEVTAPLSIRADTGSFSHSHTVVHHGHPDPLLPASELAHGGHLTQPSMQTIQPSDLTVTGMDETAPGSVQLGPSEYAVTLPMDSRVKDDYERVLSDAATSIHQFFCSFQTNSQLSNSDVSTDFQFNMT